jgi:hypothetical protein
MAEPATKGRRTFNSHSSLREIFKSRLIYINIPTNTGKSNINSYLYSPPCHLINLLPRQFLRLNLMHINSVKIYFRYRGIIKFIAFIHFQDFKSHNQVCPVFIMSESADIKYLVSPAIL